MTDPGVILILKPGAHILKSPSTLNVVLFSLGFLSFTGQKDAVHEQSIWIIITSINCQQLSLLQVTFCHQGGIWVLWKF